MNVASMALYFPGQWAAVSGEKPQASIEALFRQTDRDNNPTMGKITVKAFGATADAVLGLPVRTSAIVRGRIKRVKRQTPEGKRVHTELWVDEMQILEGRLTPLKVAAQPAPPPPPKPVAANPAPSAAQSMADAFGGDVVDDDEEIPF